MKNIQKHVLIRGDIKQFHYKSLKKASTRLQRFRGQKGQLKLYMTHPLICDVFRKYSGPHPQILDDHPWRNTEDCRREDPNFEWQNFIYLVEK